MDRLAHIEQEISEIKSQLKRLDYMVKFICALITGGIVINCM